MEYWIKHINTHLNNFNLMNKKEMKRFKKDKTVQKICLISLAIIVLLFLIAVYYFSIRSFNFPKEWCAFIVIYLVYNALIISPLVVSEQVKEYKPVWISVMILLLLINIPFIFLLFLLLSGELALPDYGYIFGYGIAISIPLGFLTIVCYDFILDKLKDRKKRIKKE